MANEIKHSTPKYRLDRLTARVLDDCDNKKWLACPSCRWHFEEELRIKSEEIDRLKKVIEELKSKNEELSLRTIMTPSYYDLYNVNVELNKKIEVLEKENKELEAKHQKALEAISRCKDEIDDKDKRIEELTHDLKKENKELKRIVVVFNNTQTEMERDTAQHECEELHEKIDSLWRVNDELNRKIKALDKENKGLKRTIAWFNDNI